MAPAGFPRVPPWNKTSAARYPLMCDNALSSWTGPALAREPESSLLHSLFQRRVGLHRAAHRGGSCCG
jgi:hypothetical protein